MPTNDSPWSREVQAFSERKLNDVVCNIAGYYRDFTTSWDAIMILITTLNLMTHPRYISRTQGGIWQVRDHMVKRTISHDASGPIALCQALCILVGGKGRSYNQEQLHD